ASSPGLSTSGQSFFDSRPPEHPGGVGAAPQGRQSSGAGARPPKGQATGDSALAHPAGDPGPRPAQRLSQPRTAALDDLAGPKRGPRARVGRTLCQTVGTRVV